MRDSGQPADLTRRRSRLVPVGTEAAARRELGGAVAMDERRARRSTMQCTDSCFALAEQSSEEPRPAQLVLVQSERRALVPRRRSQSHGKRRCRHRRILAQSVPKARVCPAEQARSKEPTEREVLELMADRRSNRAIAERLVISEYTAVISWRSCRPLSGSGGVRRRHVVVGVNGVHCFECLSSGVEELQVADAREQGWSWQRIAAVLGLGRHAVLQKYG
jgi:hypothetical protein